MTRISLSLDPSDVSVRQLVHAAVLAEDLGFDAVYVYDHLSGISLGADRTHHIWTVLGAVAGATSQLQVGPLVANVTTRHAVDIAAAVATLQDLSDGRVVLGLGAGASGDDIYAAEMDMFALAAEPAPARRRRVAETVAFLRALWAGEPHFDGHWASFHDVRAVAVPDPVPAILLGANGPKMVRLAAEVADGVNVHSWEPDLPGLVTLAREVAGARPFQVTVEAPISEMWLDPASADRRQLEALGVDQLIVSWRPTELGELASMVGETVLTPVT